MKLWVHKIIGFENFHQKESSTFSNRFDFTFSDDKYSGEKKIKLDIKFKIYEPLFSLNKTIMHILMHGRERDDCRLISTKH
jgi:hypothetical protein